MTTTDRHACGQDAWPAAAGAAIGYRWPDLDDVHACGSTYIYCIYPVVLSASIEECRYKSRADQILLSLIRFTKKYIRSICVSK